MHTVVVSDMHLSEAQAEDSKRPLWMAYKRREHFIDDDFAKLLDHLHEAASGVDEASRGPAELILNGDIFDFDNVTQLPDEPEGKVDWLARQRGLGSESWMSCFKMRCIIADHPRWFGALRTFLERGHRAVFICGNHDIELCWPGVQRLIREALGVADGDARLSFCNWCYLSGGDSYISHGHQYDPNCVQKSALNPVIEVHGRPRMRLPFGDLAARYMLNGMGYFNPNAVGNYIMSGVQYARFFLRYMLFTQPLLLWSWFWSALVTLFITLRDHLRPAMRDPLKVEDTAADVAARANVSVKQLRQLAALDVPSACTQPWRIIRELWLDRGFLLIGIALLSWQIMLHINIAWPISPLWALVALAVLLPPYLMYASRVKAKVFDEPLLDETRAALVKRITGAHTVVFGHTHKPVNRMLAGVHYLNGGFWSPAFAEPECIRRVGTQSFAWIRPGPSGERAAQLFEWPAGEATPRPLQLAEPTDTPARGRRAAAAGHAAASRSKHATAKP